MENQQEKILPYIYKCVNRETGEFYFGHRRRNKVPAKDDLGKAYFTSSKLVKPIFHKFDYEILEECYDDQDALDKERQLIKLNYGNTLLLNKAFWQNHIVTKQEYLNPERCKKLSESKKEFYKSGKWINPMTSLQSKEKVRISKIGKNNPNFGKKDVSDHLNKKITCNICKKLTTVSATKQFHGLNKCNIEYVIYDKIYDITHVTRNLSQWCKENSIYLPTVQYALKHNNKFLKFNIKTNYYETNN
jgi:hypothetical protein